jgi:hypothetical protein
MTVDELRAVLTELESQTLEDLVEMYPEAQEDLDESIGHAVFSNRMAKIPMVGAGDGVGVVFNQRTGQRTYLKVGRFDIGGGLGVREYRLVVLFFDESPLEKLAGGTFQIDAGAEAGAGAKDVGLDASQIARSREKGQVAYQLAAKGVSATFTVRVFRYTVLDLSE